MDEEKKQSHFLLPVYFCYGDHFLSKHPAQLFGQPLDEDHPPFPEQRCSPG